VDALEAVFEPEKKKKKKNKRWQVSDKKVCTGTHRKYRIVQKTGMIDLGLKWGLRFSGH